MRRAITTVVATLALTAPAYATHIDPTDRHPTPAEDPKRPPDPPAMDETTH